MKKLVQRRKARSLDEERRKKERVVRISFLKEEKKKGEKAKDGGGEGNLTKIR